MVPIVERECIEEPFSALVRVYLVRLSRCRFRRNRYVLVRSLPNYTHKKLLQTIIQNNIELNLKRTKKIRNRMKYLDVVRNKMRLKFLLRGKIEINTNINNAENHKWKLLRKLYKLR